MPHFTRKPPGDVIYYRNFIFTRYPAGTCTLRIGSSAYQAANEEEIRKIIDEIHVEAAQEREALRRSDMRKQAS